VKKKLRSQAGETLAETLITVLIIAVAMTMLAGMISATASMVKTSENKMKEYYQGSAALETFSEAESGPTVTLKTDTATFESIPIVYAKNEVFSDHTVISYRMTDD
jgi:Tfp pilus assembly protein PilV